MNEIKLFYDAIWNTVANDWDIEVYLTSSSRGTRRYVGTYVASGDLSSDEAVALLFQRAFGG